MAGLAVGFYARKRGIPFTIYEAADRVGGNCITLRHGEFLFDSGAHRLHDLYAEETAELKALLGNQLQRIDVPSLIFSDGKFVDFPLSPMNLVGALGPRAFAMASLEVLAARLRAREPDDDFQSFALQTYGKTIASRFLLNYSEKLWGAPGHRLSPRISGKRMKGLTLKTFVKEAVFGRKAKTEHLDGVFYYPRNGIGSISDALADACGEENIMRKSEVTGICCDQGRITAVEINGQATVEAGTVVSTLPLGRLLQMMQPRPPADIAALAERLRYRNIVLVTLFLDRASVTEAATVYFPAVEFPFTRLYEPRNRSPSMSPPGKTTLVLEVPCQPEDPLWTMEDGRLTECVSSPLCRAGILRESEIIGSTVTRMPCAYPLLEARFERKREAVMGFLRTFGNLELSGRSGRFAYVHIHDLMRWGRQVVDGAVAGRSSSPSCCSRP